MKLSQLALSYRISAGPLRGKDMIKVKASQKIFTDAETANLTGICLEHLHDLARTRHVGFIARVAEAAGKQADQRQT